MDIQRLLTIESQEALTLARKSAKVEDQDRYDEDPVDVDLMVNGFDSYEFDDSY